jgi:hypothetical protein
MFHQSAAIYKIDDDYCNNDGGGGESGEHTMETQSPR